MAERRVEKHEMFDPATLDFIRQHADDDVRLLALQATRWPAVDIRRAIDQIAGRRTARTKLPSWAAIEGLVYPPHLSMEQCSSEQTAVYKADVARRLGGESFVDLTGGFGVDFAFIARRFRQAVYVERQANLCEVARHNFGLLGLSQARVVCADGIVFLRETEPVGLIFIDPARRNDHGGKTFAIADCTPDISKMVLELLEKAAHILVKLSPMLDWHKAVADLESTVCAVSEAHIVAVKNECKELLLVLSRRRKHEDEVLRVVCVNDGNVFSYTEDDANGSCLQLVGGEFHGGMHLYEPHSAVMKAGCFGLLSTLFNVEAVAHDSHLFVSGELVPAFPGRRFRVDAVTSMNKKTLKKALAGISQANIAVRNFPLSAVELRRRLRLKDGGDVYLFATTDAVGRHWLLVCSKAG